MFAFHQNLLREKNPHGHHKVAYLELFFDLVFVFAITQISHFLLHNMTFTGAAQTAVLVMGVWWVWVFTSWVTNWLDPEKMPVRILMLVLMLAGLLLSTSVAEAFGNKGLVFAGAYVFMQVGRSCFMVMALKHHNAANYLNFIRIMIWMIASGFFWIAGALSAGEEHRLAFWAVAILIEYLSPSMSFRVPFLGKSSTEDWDVEGGHMSERCALFIIIALGESFLMTGETFAKLPFNGESVVSFLCAFLFSIALWWIYFDAGAAKGMKQISQSKDPGRMARIAYTYIHLFIVGGIILSAVGDELVLDHPSGHLGGFAAAIILGGPALFLIGDVLFKRIVTDKFCHANLVGLAILGLLTCLIPFASPLMLAFGGVCSLLVVAVWEKLTLRAT